MSSRDSRRWLAPVLTGVLVLCVAWIGFNAVRMFGNPYDVEPARPQGPLAEVAAATAAKLHEVEAFRYLDAAPDPENPEGIAIGGMVPNDADIDRLVRWTESQGLNVPVRLVVEGPSAKIEVKVGTH